MRAASSRSWSVTCPPSSIIAGSPPASAAAHMFDRVLAHAPRRREFGHPGRPGRAVLPRHVRGQYQRRDLPGRLQRGGDRVRGILRQLLAGLRRMHPVRHGLGDGGDVRGERGVVLQVIGGVIADDVDDRDVAAFGVVQIREAVAESRPQVQQRGGGLARDARIAVCRAGHHAFEQAQHASHAGHAVQRRDEVHLRGAGIREADFHAGIQQRAQQGFGSVHVVVLRGWGRRAG